MSEFWNGLRKTESRRLGPVIHSEEGQRLILHQQFERIPAKLEYEVEKMADSWRVAQ